MIAGILKAPYWLLPLTWLNPRQSVRALTAEVGRSQQLLMVLACLLGVGHGLEFASWFGQTRDLLIPSLAVGPLIGLAYVFGLGYLMHRRYAAQQPSLDAIRSALVLMYTPVFWATWLRFVARIIGGGLDRLEMSAGQSAAYQWLGLISVILYLVAFWMSYVCLSEATGIPQDKLDEPAKNRDLIIAFLLIVGFFVAVYLARLAGLLH